MKKTVVWLTNITNTFGDIQSCNVETVNVEIF